MTAIEPIVAEKLSRPRCTAKFRIKMAAAITNITANVSESVRSDVVLVTRGERSKSVFL